MFIFIQQSLAIVQMVFGGMNKSQSNKADVFNRMIKCSIENYVSATRRKKKYFAKLKKKFYRKKGDYTKHKFSIHFEYLTFCRFLHNINGSN